jgi:Zn-dependent M16 (insulinase) family peptidase
MHGFTLLRDERIDEINARARIYRHDKTGAELVSVELADENKVFGINFRTPARNSTGVAHILEHSVLCGSRKYNLKEPFVELLKGSLHTFLNAFTYPDKTCYPVASQNLKDFYNLIDVYMDAALHPNLTRHTFEQEGWHYEVERTDAPLVYKGVVFNEMKGVYSSPDSVLSEAAQQSLFPDNPYGVDSGGHPVHIPDLTWEQLVEFHQRFYHPSNARIWFYGDDPPEERLRIMDAWLSEYEPVKVDSDVPLQAPFDQPRSLTRYYPAGRPAEGTDASENGDNKSFLVVNWLLPETTDVETNLGLNILCEILIGTPASPLRKALIDSGLGEDLAGAGLECQLRQMYFSTGLRGVDAANTPQVEDLVHATLRDLVKKGFNARTIEASINTIEFRLRENNTGSFPRGLSLMVRALTTWLYDADPLATLRFETPLAAIKEKAGSRYFEDLVDRLLIQNPHRTTLTLHPDPDLGRQDEDKELARLTQARSRMSVDDITACMRNTVELKAHQTRPDDPAELAKIPCLKRADLEPAARRIPIDEIPDASGARVLFHDLFTQGIVYLDLGFNLHSLPPNLLPYMGLFGSILLETGTEKEDFVSLAQRIGTHTGGIEPQTFTSMIRDQYASTAWLFLRGKAMARSSQELLAILSDVLSGAKLDNRERIKQIVLEEKAAEESEVVPSGHRVVASRLRARFNEADWAAEQVGGVEYLFFVRRLAERIDRDWPGVLADLEQIRRTLMTSNGLIANVTTDAASWKTFAPHLHAFIAGLPRHAFAPADWALTISGAMEGLSIPAKVNYVGQGADLFRLGYKLKGSALVVSRYLRNAWLWERVRVQGGAYGGFCALDQRSGAFVFTSYRDPNVKETLNVYNQTAAYLNALKIGEEEVTKAIIGTVGDLDAYQLPDAKGFTSMIRLLTGDTEEKRQRIRDEVLATTAEDFLAFAEALDMVRTNASVVVLGNGEALKAAGIAPITRVL